MPADPACLPGLATHLIEHPNLKGKFTSLTACGNVIPNERAVEDWQKVDCLSCRKTKKYKAARGVQ